MTKDELVKKLRELKGDDPEMKHIKADELLLEFINIPEVTEVFEDLGKWYA